MTSIAVAAPTKLDLACGSNKREGFHGVDKHLTDGVDTVYDLLSKDYRYHRAWPWDDGSIEELHCSHFFEHVPGPQRILFMDECWRILKVGGTLTIIVPYYLSHRAVQDPTHAWPPVCEASFLYFNRSWREANKLTHYLGSCNFEVVTMNHAIDKPWDGKSTEAIQDAVQHLHNVVADLHVVLKKQP